MLKEVRKTKTDPKIWESYVLHLGYLRIIVFFGFFPVGGGGPILGGGRNLAISAVAMKLTPQEKWKILPIHPTREVEDTAYC